MLLTGLSAVLLSVGAGLAPVEPAAAAATAERPAPGSGVTVAVVDTGFDTEHEFFRRSDGGSAFTREVCVDACGPGVVTGPGVAASPTSDRAARRHGTHVAGVIAGAWQSPPAGRFARLRGVAPGASLIAVRVFGDDDRGVEVERITTALQWLAERVDALDLDVVNVSLGGGRFTALCSAEQPALQRAVTALWDAGVVVVVGAGNDGDADAMAAPGCLRHVVSVAAVDRTGSLAPWSNRNGHTTVAAPGVGVWSAVPGLDATGRRAAISVDSGTSVAAARVSGVVAQLRQYRPDATPDQIVSALRSGARQVEGVPVLDTRRALLRLTVVSARPPATPAPAATRR